ncbi:DUF2062 domain-containing protein [Acidicapsa ligni]|uniref:DUF2062 domain-containing protein n=1 Tax=Acidicapsa ligni TaxID=542300 RepID=UPI0021DF95E3|nr:DUF2062 domain-containing protein [Acidicapsa ligni]
MQLIQSPRIQAALDKIIEWGSYGCTPRQLAFTLALGFAIGCIPVFGVTSGICALLALLLRLNMPAIQAANWIAMPVQVLLLIPFLRIGEWLFAATPVALNRSELLARIQNTPLQVLEQMGGLFGHAILVWLILAAPALLVLTLVLTMLITRIKMPNAIGAKQSITASPQSTVGQDSLVPVLDGLGAVDPRGVDEVA